MKILYKPYTRNQLDDFITECNLDGKFRIEYYKEAVYGLYDYEVYQNGEIIDLRGSEEYEAEQLKIRNEERKTEILSALEELDKKRIRAICEPQELRDDGTSWLDYYNSLIFSLRDEYNSLI